MASSTPSKSTHGNNATRSSKHAVDLHQDGNLVAFQASLEELTLNVPPPTILADYCKIHPDAAERFFQWAQEEAQHRRKLDEKIVNSQINDSRLGLCFGLIVALAGLGVAAWAVTCNQPWLAGVLGGSTIVSLAVAFIRGSRSVPPAQKKEIPQN